VARLSNKQLAFVEEYLCCWNATEAARRAGYSEHTAHVQGSRLLSNAKVQEYIKSRLAEKAMSADEVLTRLAEQARASIGDFIEIDEKGRWKVDLGKAKTDDKLHLIKSLSPTQYGVKVELYDAQAALVHLGRAHGLFTDNVNERSNQKIEIEYVNDWRLV
jgi:phage terminase small subunit